MAAILDAIYILGILVVAVGGLFGVWWFSRDQGELSDKASNWRGLIVATATSLFVLALVIQFFWYLVTHKF